MSSYLTQAKLCLIQITLFDLFSWGLNFLHFHIILFLLAMSLQPTAEWHDMQDIFYRKHRLYQMQWKELDLSQYRVSASSFGGPIALLRDDRQLLEVGSTPTLDSAIHVYTASGQSIGRIEYEGLHIAGFSWNSREQLVCVQEDGSVRIFSLSGQEPISFSLGPDARERGILECRFWDHGLVAMTADYRFLYVNDMAEPKPRMLPGVAQISEYPTSWTIVPPHLSRNHHLEVLVSVDDTIVAVDPMDSQDQLLDQGPYSRISVSPNGALVALCSTRGRIQVVSIDFQRSYSDYTRDQAEEPVDIAWCGNDAVIASYQTEAILVGPFGDTLNFPHDSPMHLVQELDGVRMFNGLVHEYLYKVSEDSKSVFQIGSTSPAALLYDAMDNLKSHSSRADEIVRSIRDDMTQAVDTCISAAGSEPIIEYQQSLLRAASLGKSFLTIYNGDKLVDMCKHLRVINSLSSYDVGLPVSLLQFQSLPFEEWVARLMNRNKHQLAQQICQYTDEPLDQIYIHWACAKIRGGSALDDDSLYRVIKDKLDSCSTALATFVDIAEVANTCGYQKLAIKILMNDEPRAANQVPLLISMGQDESAMEAAIRSGDADLVYFVIFHLFKQLPLADFFHVISRNAVAAQLFEKYCVEQATPVLEDYYYQDDAFAKSARLILLDNIDPHGDVPKMVANLKVALKMLSNDKSCAQEAKAIGMQIKLLQTQRQLDHDMPSSSDTDQPGSFVGLPLNQTISQCLLRGNYTRAQKLRSEFKVPERRFCWIKLQALVKRRDWVELARLAAAKNPPPIGYRPFVDECIRALQYQEAAKYIPKCDGSDRASLYLRIGFYREAAQAAAAIKDINMLRHIHTATHDSSLQHEIAQQISQIG